jgi:alpha-ketoglutarate-dependent taurine dioxygenase
MSERRSDAAPSTPIRRLSRAERQAASVVGESLVRAEPLQADGPLPLAVTPAVEGLRLLDWGREHRAWLDEKLLRHGGVLLRGFTVALEEFEELLRATVGGEELLEYTYRSTPRRQVAGNLLTSTEYPADQSIPMHNEESYTRSWPLRIGFLCVKAAAEGGETPIADSRRVLAAIPAEVREELARRRVMYVRNFGEHLDLPWQEVFQTSDRAEVERFCREADIEYEWRGESGLRTRQVCQAVARHPELGDEVWFNQAHLFHVSSLPAEVRDYLLAEFGEEGLPRHARFGDGGAIPAEALESIRAAYRAAEVAFPWREGDVLLLDNMLCAHGRRPFVGPRRIVVGMARAHGMS